MSTIYDMTSGRIESLPVENNTAAARDEHISALAVQQLPSRGTEAQPPATSIHLVRALLNKGR